MAKIYYKQIIRGAITLEDVPEKWRGEVGNLIKAGTKS